MPVITAIVGRVEDLDPALPIDPLELVSEERSSPHFSTVTSGGRVVRISLPRGAELQDGDVLAVENGTAIVVSAKPEALIRMVPGDDPMLWWAACYQLGNFHRPARFAADGVLTPADPLVAKLLDGMQVPYERVTAPFVGRRFGAAGAHHHHHDDHHHHDHGHRHHGHHHHHGHDEAHEHGAKPHRH